MKLVVGISGATGAIFGIRLLEVLKNTDVETHLIISSWASTTIQTETSYSAKEVKALADYSYSHKNVGAEIASGSFQVDGMVVAPCSMKTLASIRMGFADNLITRAADVMLKERKQLTLLTRETPLSDIHLENMLALSKMGAMIFPPMPAFYNHPQNMDDMIDHLVHRLVDQFGIHLMPDEKRWDGLIKNKKKPIK